MSVNAACGGYRPVTEFDPGRPAAPTALEGTPLTRLWQSRPLRGPSAPFGLDSIAAYLGGSDRRVVSVDLATGRTRWSKRLSGPVVGGVLRADSVVYTATDRPGGKAYALLAASGNQLWSTGTGYVQAPPLLAGNRLLVLTRRGEVMAIDTRDGEIRWRRPIPSERVGPLLVDRDRVLVSSYDSLYLVRVDDGKVLLRRRAPGMIASPWVRAGGNLVTGTGDSLVAAVSADSLKLQWKARLDGPLLVAPVAAGDTVYCVTQLGSLYQIIPGPEPVVTRLRDARWAATSPPATFGPWILVGGSEGALRAFRRSDGTEAWSLMVGRPLELAPLLLDDSEFLTVGGRGDVHRLRM